MNLPFNRFLLPVMMLIGLFAAAQPANDNCANASTVVISNNGYGLGTFTSAQADLTNATVEAGETFYSTISSAGENKKSVWYKFTLPTARYCTLTLDQPSSLIASNDVGFTVYKTNSCFPNTAEADSALLAAQSVFGHSTNPCLKPGDYLVHVSSNNAADGPIFITLLLDNPSPAAYDLPDTAYNFGVLSSCQNYVDFATGCQTVQDTSESCPALGPNYLDWTQSVWLTFTTPAYIDWAQILIGPTAGCCFNNNPGATFAYNLYKGDAHTAPINSLTLVDGCVVDTFVNYGPWFKREYECELDTSTHYSIQIFFNKTFADNVRVYLDYLGAAATRGPQPTTAAVAPANILGVLPNGNTNVYDNWGCNSRLSQNICGETNPASGALTHNGVNYTLNDWYTFQISQPSNIYMNVYNTGNAPYVRIFKKDINASCNNIDTATDLYNQFVSTTNLTCVQPGTYSMQIFGQDDDPQWGCAWRDNLGQRLNIAITVNATQAYNHYSLITPGAVDTVNDIGNTYVGLTPGSNYNTGVDTFGCDNAVLPAGTHCNNSETKAMYFEFDVADSGIMSFQGSFSWNYWYAGSILYQGDANALSTAQVAHLSGDTINGLSPATLCFGNNSCHQPTACVVPGMYTLVTYGDSTIVGQNASWAMSEQLVTTIHHTGALAEDMGSIIDSIAINGGTSVTSQTDHFSCMDNPDTIGGQAPCPLYQGNSATKLIYRQFYLSTPALTTITSNAAYTCANAGTLSLFYGEATNGIGTLTPVGGPWTCFTSNYTGPCTTLPAGWYTVVSYGEGPTYGSPNVGYNGNRGYGGDVGLPNAISISFTQAPPGPIYDYPYKACIDTVTHLPFAIKPTTNRNTNSYPVTDTTYALYRENYNCTTDTPFTLHPLVPCTNSYQPHRVTYYVFTVPQMSYIHISGMNGAMCEVFPFDVRTDSAQMLTTQPVQPCNSNGDYTQLCRLVAGTYTLVIFPPDNFAGSSIQPSIYIDSVGYSRFDNAVNAYDFGEIPMDSNWYSGMPGDVNPITNTRAASNDFFYCTTGAQTNDPATNACYVAYDPLVYNSVNNDYEFDAAAPGNGYNWPRRNLWYTFELDKGGTCYIKVNNMTPDKASQYPFSIYKSDVNGGLTFSQVVATGQVDSTAAQGLTAVANNYYYYCGYYNQISFYRSPCGAIKERYYLVVDNTAGMEPNSQCEVNILYDTINTNIPLYDHYSEANVINGLNQTQPPYTQQPLDTGIWMGGTDNFTCATQDSLDPNPCNCVQKNLWYKFTINETGLIRLRYLINGANQTSVDGCQLSWYRQVIPGDSTTNGLAYLPGVQYNYYDYPTGTYWYQTCITAGTYYILMSGCNRNNETVRPVVWFIDQHGDYCSDPISGTISAPGSINMSAIVDCHSIGGDFGEDGSNMGCLIPNGDSIPQFKSTWYRFTITGPDTFDITPVLTDNTNVPSNQIRYRMLYGTCNAMNPGSCFVSASTVNTFNCMTQGSYYIQVVEPANQLGYPFGQVTGTINVQINATPAQPGCIPVSNCFVVANWVSSSSCAKDSVFLINQSTEGDSILYHWDFGFGGDTSNIKNPVVSFPTPNLTQTYSVLLTVTNTACNKQDSLRQTITVNQQPTINLPGDTTLCSPISLILHATSWPGTTYLWNDGTTDSLYNVTAAGTYTVTDSFNNCKVSKAIVIGTGTQPVVNLGPDQALCAGMNYQANLTQATGETFLWNTGSTVPNYTTDSAGTYSVTATIGTCIARDTINISNLANTRPFGRDTNLCTGTTMTLDATTFGASSYLWNDGSTNPVKTTATAGLYFVKITVSNCFVVDSITLHSVTSPAPHITGDSTLCFTGDSATINAGAGYTTYKWSTGDSTQTITVASPATYRVTVSNAAGCIGIDSFIIRQSSPMVLTTANTNVSCYGGNNGAIQLTVNGGTATYTYLWNQSQTTINISNLVAGNYSVTVKDVIGCTASIADTITQPTAITDSVIVTPVICFGQANGTASLTVLGGVTPYTFSWSNAATTQNISALIAGTYTVTITDNDLCNVSASAIITQPDVLQLALTDSNVTCSGFNNGKINTTVQGGITPYTYLWTGGQTTSSVSNLQPGNYGVTVTDSNNCIISGTTVITSPQPLQLLVQSVNVLCFGNSTGSITTSLTGGTSAYLYNWSNGATTSTIAQLVAGNYTITGTDANNCTVDSTIIITQPTALAITLDSSFAPSCYGYSDGRIYTTTNGGVTPYTLSWSTGPNTANINSLPNGTYTITATDSNQCTATKTVNLASPDTIIITPAITNVSCYGNNDGKIQVVVTGGTSPYAYVWSNANTTPQILNLAPGSYSVTVTDSHNCNGSDIGLTITQPDSLTISLISTNETCPVAKNGAVMSTTNGGTTPYTYVWSNGANTQNIINIHAGTYKVTVDDNNGCNATATSTVIIQPTLILEATVENPLCPPLQNGSIALVAGGNTNPYQYTWSGPQQGANPENLSPGNYAVTVTDTYGCTIDSSFTLQYQFVLTLQATPSFTIIKLGQLVQLATTTNGTQLHYIWTPSEGLTCNDCAAPVASPAIDTHYTVTGQDNNGCTAFDTLDIQVIPDYDLFIPNAFTPNNDGNNDFFEIFGNKAAMRFVSVEVFDRWGEKVFEANGPDFEWDGTYKGKLMPTGVFVYAIHISFSDGHSDKLFKGSVTLIR